MIRKDLVEGLFPEPAVDNFSFKFAGYRSRQPADAHQRHSPKNYEEIRKPVKLEALTITPALIEWLRGLPASVRPRNLILKFPRVANKLAHAAERPKVVDRLLNEYMLDDRGGRKGFPFDVLQELANLREYYDGLEREE